MKGLVCAAMVLSIFLGCFPAADALAGTMEKGGGMVGKEAPLFQTKQADGKPFSLQTELREHKYTLINFWGLRCSSCIEELPTLEEMYRKYSSRGLSILGVNVDGVDCASLSAQIQKMGFKMSYKVLADEDLKIGDLYALTVAPLTYVVNGEGKIVYQHLGFEEGDEEKIAGFLATLFP